MIFSPRTGDRVQVWYGPRWRGFMPHHGAVGTVEAAGRGPGPRNALVRLDAGGRTCVPRGNLRRKP